ncbi:unnamed protein product [Linum trigynum]|uniref:Uncharacterized protein n=1 Tax=Linum trigynum TaxID=586398 RepID=A0AAV2EZA2_9ROSI
MTQPHPTLLPPSFPKITAAALLLPPTSSRKTVRVGGRIPGLDLAVPRMLRPSQFPSRVSFPAPAKPPLRFRVLAMAVKRSPKRLKYSAPRFTKEGGLVYVEVDPSGEDSWKMDPIVELLKQGAVGVIPTDTVYDFSSFAFLAIGSISFNLIREAGVVGDDGPAALAAENRVFDVLPVVDEFHRLDDGESVLSETVGDGEIRITGFGAVVVDSKPTADVKDLHVGAETNQFRIDMGSFADPIGEQAGGWDLRSDVKMQELEAIKHSDLLQTTLN